MYKGWQPRKDGPQRFLLSKGILPKGIAFAMVEALMGKLNPDGASFAGFENGAALVVGSGNQDSADRRASQRPAGTRQLLEVRRVEAIFQQLHVEERPDSRGLLTTAP